MKPYFLRFFLLLLPLFLQVSYVFSQQERILNYEVNLELNKDRSIDVKEQITVYASGNQIKRGITRSLPNNRTINGKRVPVRYIIKNVMRDGKKEPYHTRNEKGMEVLYLGKRDVFLRPGQYHYTIEYEVPDQVEELENIDEIYWNAIGTDVIFPIEKSSVMVKLPVGTKALQKHCYIGKYGSTNNNCLQEEFNDGNEIFFNSGRALKPYEGLTIGVGMEKGVMTGPSLFKKYGVAMFLVLTSLGLLIYFVTTWKKHGVDPPKPTAYPLFASPGGYSPSSISYIMKEKYKDKKVTASIIDLAIKGYIHIDVETEKSIFSSSTHYKLTRLKQDVSELFPEDKALMQQLFSSSDTIMIDGTYQEVVKDANTAHQSSILTQHQAFVNEGNNRKFLWWPIIISLLAIALSVFLLNRRGAGMDMIGTLLPRVVFMALPLFFILMVSKSGSNFVQKALTIGTLALFFILPGLSSLSMGPSELKGFLYQYFNGADINTVMLIFFVPMAVIALFLYAYLIKKPSIEKLKIQSEIEGFKMYLATTEKDRLNLLNPPDRTPEHFEAMLPYAFALGVQNNWSALFKTILEQAAYQPNWTNDRHIVANHSFASDFNRSMASSATKPSESSSGGGSGGGGFSGGGGGGGGVGGW